MKMMEQLAQYRQFTELMGITGMYHLFCLVGNLIDKKEGVIEQHVSQLASRHLLRHLKFDVETIGIEHIQGLTRYSVASNHASYLDWAVLLGYFPSPLRFIAKKELARLPAIGSYLKHRGVLIDRKSGATALQAIRDALTDEQPWPILIFPEGTRTSDGEIKPFKIGGLKILFEANMPIVPITLIGTYDALSRHDRMVKTNQKIRLVISSPVHGNDFSTIEEAIAEVEKRVRSALKAYK